MSGSGRNPCGPKAMSRFPSPARTHSAVVRVPQSPCKCNSPTSTLGQILRGTHDFVDFVSRMWVIDRMARPNTHRSPASEENAQGRFSPRFPLIPGRSMSVPVWLGSLPRTANLCRASWASSQAEAEFPHHTYRKPTADDSGFLAGEQHTLESKTKLTGNPLFDGLVGSRENQHLLQIPTVATSFTVEAGRPPSIYRPPPVYEGEAVIPLLYYEAPCRIRRVATAQRGDVEFAQLDSGIVRILKDLKRNAGDLVLILLQLEFDRLKDVPPFLGILVNAIGEIVERLAQFPSSILRRPSGFRPRQPRAIRRRNASQIESDAEFARISQKFVGDKREMVQYEATGDSNI